MTRSRSVAWATMIAIAGTLSTPFSVSAAPVAATAADACARQQGFYLRRNKLDISIYNASIDASAAEGAAISYTGDRENDTDTAEVHAVSWQPYNLDWRLGGNYFRFSRPFDFFFQVKLEADGLRVNNPGLTSLTADTDYLWIGGTATLRASLFNGLLGWDRLTWVTSYTYFDDTNSSRDSSKNSSQNIHLFTTNLAYNFTESGKTSISVEYQNGTNRDTLEKLNQYLVTLNVKY
jgi:hypothetical protein